MEIIQPISYVACIECGKLYSENFGISKYEYESGAYEGFVCDKCDGMPQEEIEEKVKNIRSVEELDIISRTEIRAETLKNSSKEELDIIYFLKSVCEGIRGEYENGWSYRSLDEDIKSLKYLLHLLKNSRQ